MKTNKYKLAFCPIGKFVFSHEDALCQKAAIREKLEQWNVDFIDLETVLPDGMVRDKAHVDPVVEFSVTKFHEESKRSEKPKMLSVQGGCLVLRWRCFGGMLLHAGFIGRPRGGVKNRWGE